MSDRLNQKDVAGLLLLAAGVGAAGLFGVEVARWANKNVAKKTVKKWWEHKAAPPLMYAGLNTSSRLASWFGKRVVTIDQLKPGMDPQKWAMAVDRVRTVSDELCGRNH